VKRALLDSVGARVGGHADDFSLRRPVAVELLPADPPPDRILILEVERAIDSLRITTGGAVAASLARNPRPARSRVPTVSK
jgi:hypothetical protein